MGGLDLKFFKVLVIASFSIDYVSSSMHEFKKWKKVQTWKKRNVAAYFQIFLNNHFSFVRSKFWHLVAPRLVLEKVFHWPQRRPLVKRMTNLTWKNVERERSFLGQKLLRQSHGLSCRLHIKNVPCCSDSIKCRKFNISYFALHPYILSFHQFSLGTSSGWI